ncbi:hypothetical protein [Gottfriedia solisilvae]|uniref:hypothetical protein n=1 Tax=Gottfriedia solisilvae TaxID=1516104 RepID=UPI003D2EB952
MTKFIKAIIVLSIIVSLSACSINQNKESFRIFDETQSNVTTKVINNEDEFNRLKKLLNDANLPDVKWPDRDADYTIKHEKEGQSELINNYKVWIEDSQVILVDIHNHKYGTFDDVDAQKLKEILKIENL